ncbi:MAG: hypothetical protein FD123_2413 [Bacteroidetes bacterium]|nr:MAG: hypothetical protein FD123_2413 [Bacteroidota bacterium]
MKTLLIKAGVLASVFFAQHVSAQTITGSGSTNYVPKFTGSTTIGNSNMYINSTYNTGIGTTTASTLMHIVSNTVNGSSSNYLNMRLEKSLGGNQDNYLDFLFTSNPGGGGFTAGNGSLSLRMNNTYGTSDMIFMQNPTTLGFILKSSGNFGIATVSPSERFQVDGGNMLVRGTNNFASSGHKAFLYLGSTSHFISATSGTGVSIGTSGYSNGLLHILQSGKVAIGDGSTFTSMPGTYKLYVDDGILTEKVRVAVYGSGSWADYVFAPGYRLRPLSEVEQFIQTNKHLPEVPSADDVVEKGIDVASMDATLLKKVEELTLYIIEQNKRIEKLEKERGRK